MATPSKPNKLNNLTGAALRARLIAEGRLVPGNGTYTPPFIAAWPTLKRGALLPAWHPADAPCLGLQQTPAGFRWDQLPVDGTINSWAVVVPPGINS